MEHIVGTPTHANLTTVNPIGLVMLLVLGMSILIVPRRWAIFPFLVMACFVSAAQRIVVFGLDFNFLRILVLFGALRILVLKKTEYGWFRWCRLDTCVVLWGLSSALFYTLRIASLAAFVNRLGFCFDAIGMYLLFRCLIRDWRDFERIVTGFLWISMILAVLFLIENRTGRNLFSIFGGVNAMTAVRNGRLRCQGAFSHPILAGCFWASVIPLFAVLWWKTARDRVRAILGCSTTLAIIFCSASSTPVMGVLAAALGGGLFCLRRQMKVIRWGLVGMLILLSVAMKAPVWHLISRVSAVGGSTGYHRFVLIDQAINRFTDWAVMGCSGYTVQSWGVYAGDVTNQYVLEGVNGGFVTMCLFVYCIVIAFSEIGKLWRHQKPQSYRMKLVWALGVSLFIHCVNFVGVSYFGQTSIIWYILLAAIGSLSISRKAAGGKA